MKNLLGGSQQGQEQRKTLDDVIRRFNERVADRSIEITGNYNTTIEHLHRRFRQMHDNGINMNDLYNIVNGEINYSNRLETELNILTHSKTQQGQEQKL